MLGIMSGIMLGTLIIGIVLGIKYDSKKDIISYNKFKEDSQYCDRIGND